MEKLLGSWIFPLMFRRDVFCVMEQLFKETDRLPKKSAGVLLPRSREELLQL